MLVLLILLRSLEQHYKMQICCWSTNATEAMVADAPEDKPVPAMPDMGAAWAAWAVWAQFRCKFY